MNKIEIQRKIETSLLLNGKAKEEVKDLHLLDELEVYYKANGFKTNLSVDDNNKHYLIVEFRK